jgi:hypothetical protein
MDDYGADIFTFRHADPRIVDDVAFKDGFLDPAFRDLLASLSEDDILKIVPCVLGYQYMDFH